MPPTLPLPNVCINGGADPLVRGRRPRRPARGWMRISMAKSGTGATRADQDSPPFVKVFSKGRYPFFPEDALPPSRRDLSLLGQQGQPWASVLTAPDLSALGSALRSHPCVALSSAQAIPSLSNSGIPPSTRLCYLRFSSPLRIIQRPCLQHRHQHRQPSVRYSPCRPPVTMAGLAQRRIMLLRCGILLHARARPVIQRVPQPHIAAITHTHHLFLAALPRYWRYAPIAPQPVVISFPERS